MAMPLVASTEWWEAKGRGDKYEDPMAWHALTQHLAEL
jgi:hypothetical protein